MTDQQLYTSLSANTIMAKLTNHGPPIDRLTLFTDCEDGFRSGRQNVSLQQQFFLKLPSPGRSHYTTY